MTMEGFLQQNRGKIGLCLVAVLCLLLAAPCHAQKLNFQNYTKYEGLPQEQIIAVYQDSRGFMWFGTFAGVSRYDGREFITYTAPADLPHNIIQAISEDNRGRLLFGSFDGGLAIFDDEVFTVLDETSGLPSNRVNDIVVIGNSIWLATGGGIVKLQDDKVVEVFSLDIPVQDYTVIQYVEGVIWIGTTGGLYQFDEQKFKEISIGELFDPQVNDLLAEADGTIWVCTNSGLILIQDNIASRASFNNFSDRARFLSAAYGPFGARWFSTDIGLLYFAKGQYFSVHEEQGLANNMVYTIHADRERNLWFGTSGGLSKLRPGAFVYYNSETGLVGDDIVALYEDSRQRIWACSGNAGVSVLSDNGSFSLTEDEGLPNPYIYAAGESANGDIIIGTRDSVCLWDGTDIKVIRPNTAVTHMFTEKNGTVWITSLRSILRYRNGIFDEPLTGLTPEHPKIYAIAQAPNGDIWFGSRNLGIIIWSGSEITILDENNGFTQLDIWDISFDGRGRAWIGSNGDGVFIFDGTNIDRLTTSDGLPDDHVWQILHTTTGETWINTNNGYARLIDGKIRTYTVDDGLCENEGSVGACLEDSNGNLWFGSSRGLNSFIDDYGPAYEFNPDLVIERALINGLAADLASPIIINGDQDTLEFIFTALSYRNEYAVQYQHRVAGLQQDWSEPGFEHTVLLERMPPGDYSFEVRAQYRGEIGPKTASLAFHVYEPFIGSMPFYILLALAAILLVSFIAILHTRSLQNEKARLDTMIDHRTRELQQANAELKTFNTAVSNNLKVPLRHISGFSDLALDNIDDHDALNTYLSRIRGSAEHMNQMISDLLKLSNAGSMELMPVELDLSLFGRVTVRELREENPEHQVSVSIDKTIPARGNERLLWNVVEQLISNAWKATRNTKGAEISFGSDIINNHRRYYVRDNGVGIPAEMLGRLFVPFSVLHQDTEFPGVGLGLVIAERIIQRHSGRIWAESNPGQGSSFYFTLWTE